MLLTAECATEAFVNYAAHTDLYLNKLVGLLLPVERTISMSRSVTMSVTKNAPCTIQMPASHCVAINKYTFLSGTKSKFTHLIYI